MNGSSVAVVIPCYELGRTLEEAVESVRTQTRPVEEIVVVDDGSTDPYTRQVLSCLGNADVAVLTIEHGGPARARNAGFERTTAPLVVFLDADDLLEAPYVETMAGTLERRPDLDFVCCALQAFGLASYRWCPPPYTVANAIGRGACGHISALFRRQVWERIGGFDDSFSAYEDVDFWLTALELGFKGEILDDALLRYRVREGSRYHRGISTQAYLSSKKAQLQKHAASVREHGAEIFATQLDFEREITAHAGGLEREQTRLHTEAKHAQAEIQAAKGMLEQLGLSAFDWGDVRSAIAEGASSESHALHAFYLDQVRELWPQPGAGTIVVGPTDPWPHEEEIADAIVVNGALERELDPRPGLTRCRRALRAGGTLLVAATALPADSEDLWHFTEASLRSLLTELFPPADVEVRCFGNLLASIAHVAGAPADALTPRELGLVDPRHPVLVLGSGRAPGEGATGSSHVRRPAPAKPLPGRRGVILAYHRVAELSPDPGFCTPPETFRRHVDLLVERYSPMSLADLVSAAVGEELPPGAVAVTFDDGYLDNLEVASPLLVEARVPATFFVNSGTLGTGETAWDSAARILLHDGSLPPWLRFDLEDGLLKLSTRSAAQRRDALGAIQGRLLHMTADKRRDLVERLCAWSGLDPEPRSTHRLLTRDELVRLAERPGHEIGAHGVSHLYLQAHPVEVRRAELAGDRIALGRLLGRSVRCLAYAYGGCDLATVLVAADAGYDVACTVDPDPMMPESDPLRAPRLEIAGEDVGTLDHLLSRALLVA